MKILLVAVGKPKEKAIESLVNKYLERTRQFASINRVNVKDYSGKNPVERIKTRETENIFKVLKPRDYVILLDEKGKTMNSKDFADWLDLLLKKVPGRLVFITGGAYGTDPSLQERADMLLSLSMMTFPHELCLVFIAEQIYRGLNIIEGTSYHH
jgi:23S rRNA (pseudouridine1915-N3)-methyltransferase